MTDVLLGQAYYLRFDEKLWRAQQPYAPLGTLYAAACLRERGLGVALFDAMLASSEDEWAAALDRTRPRIAAIYEDSFNYLSKMCLLRMREAAIRMIRMARARGCTVLVSGSDATDHPDLYLAEGAAAVVLGEGDVTLGEALGRILSGETLGGPAPVTGLAYVDADGCIQRTGARAPVRTLDALPFPAWDLIDIERYRAVWQARHGYYSVNVVTSRGCPFHCNWCAKPIYGQRYGVRSPENVADEIAWLRQHVRPDHIWFADDVFGLTPTWIPRFAAALQERHAVTPFRCLMRADQVTDDAVAALTAAGCKMVWMGAESGSQKVLDAMEKGQRVNDVRQAARRLQAAGIGVGFFLQFGYPGELRADIDATLALVRETEPDDIGVSVSYPLPGTRFHDRVRAELGSKQNWVDSSDLALMFPGAYSPTFYRMLHRAVHHEFRVRRQARRLARGDESFLRRLRTRAAWAYNTGALAFRRWQLDRLENRDAGPHPTPLRPAMSPAAAAVPSRQDD
jgi:anaerobic magnesium-protoporphyrin IX monomethyl ester cyclase